MSINNNSPYITPGPGEGPVSIPQESSTSSASESNRSTTVYTNRSTTVPTPERLETAERTNRASQEAIVNLTGDEPFFEPHSYTEHSADELDNALSELAEQGLITKSEAEELSGMTSPSSTPDLDELLTHLDGQGSHEAGARDVTEALIRQSSDRTPSAGPGEKPPVLMDKKAGFFSGAKKVLQTVSSYFSGGIDQKQYKENVLNNLTNDIRANKNNTEVIDLLQNKKLNDARNAVSNSKNKDEVHEALEKNLGKLPASLRSLDASKDLVTTSRTFSTDIAFVKEGLKSLGKFILSIGLKPLKAAISLPGHVTSGVHGLGNIISKISIVSNRDQQMKALNFEKQKLSNQIYDKFGDSINGAVANGLLGLVSDYKKDKIKTPTEFRNDFKNELKNYNLEL